MFSGTESVIIISVKTTGSLSVNRMKKRKLHTSYLFGDISHCV